VFPAGKKSEAWREHHLGVGIGDVHVCVQISLELMDRGSTKFGSHVLHMQYAMNLPSKIIAHRNGKLPATVSNLFIIIP
jgi:hypothetical protein